jgi:hypothetical protein
MQLVVAADGAVRCLYDEALDFSSLGVVLIRRASHVEPNERGKWLADLSPVDGPMLGPFSCRSAALLAEQQWLEANWLSPMR